VGITNPIQNEAERSKEDTDILLFDRKNTRGLKSVKGHNDDGCKGSELKNKETQIACTTK
jgi:hypothetical protein